MAKKKTENIKATPVLRVQSEDPTPSPEQTGTRTYQIMDPWKDRDVVNLVDVKSVDGEITDVKVNGQPAGGGGMKTANVLISNNTGAAVRIALPIIPNPDLPSYNIAAVFEASTTDHTVKVILNTEGQTLGNVLDQVHDAFGDGGVEVFNGTIAVTGDGTLELE